MKIEVGKTYVTKDGNVKIIHDLVSPCAGFGRFVGIMDNGIGYNYVVTFTEDGVARLQSRTDVSDSRQITGEVETFLVLNRGSYMTVEGQLNNIKDKYDEVYRKV